MTTVGIKFTLPKVNLRVKTSPTELVEPERESRCCRQYQPSPLVFQERHKMKRQIQESYLRCRQMKNNNYRKKFFSFKKHQLFAQDKNNATVLAKNKQQSHKQHAQFMLQVEDYKKDEQSFIKKFNKQRLTTSLVQPRATTSPAKQLPSQLQIQINKIVSFCRHSSMHDSCLQGEEAEADVENKKCQNLPGYESKRLLVCLKNLKNQRNMHKIELVKKSSEFQIDPWRNTNARDKTEFEEQIC